MNYIKTHKTKFEYLGRRPLQKYSTGVLLQEITTYCYK